MVLTVFAGIARFERSLISERTSSGRKAAQERGVRFGRPCGADRRSRSLLADGWIDEGKSAREVARVILKCHPATLYRELARAASTSRIDQGMTASTIAP